MFDKISNADLAAFLRGTATYFRSRPTGGEDSMHWANEANATRCEIAADRLASQTLRTNDDRTDGMTNGRPS